MKILFLDIDGVLNSVRSCHAFKGYPHSFDEFYDYTKPKQFDHVAIALIQNLCEVTGAKIVLSSSWRKLFTVKEVADALRLPIIDATPDSHDGFRGREIERWLDLNPEVSHYAIVDDDSDMTIEQKNGHFVQTDGFEGLSYANYLALKDILEEVKDS